MPTRDKKLVELEMLLQRPRNKRKIVFGKHLAQIKFDNKKSDFLTISGSSAGVALSGSSLLLDGTINILGGAQDVGSIVSKYDNYGISLLGAGTTTSHIIMVSTSKTNDISVASSEILTNGENLYLNADGAILNFGEEKDLSMYHFNDSYMRNTTGRLIISSSAEPQYICVSGSTMILGPLGDKGTIWTPQITPIAGLNTITDCAVDGHGNSNAIATISDGQGGGEMIRIGSFDGTVAKGKIVTLSSSTWYLVDRSVTGKRTELLAVALDDAGGLDAGLVLLRGIVRIDASLMNGSTDAATDIGSPVYLSTTAGEYDMAVSSTSGDIVRIVGHVLDSTGGGDHLIYFNPSNDWVKVT